MENQQKHYQILSLGAGVQSSAMALMAAYGELEPRVDAAIFADTQGEPEPVYEWLDYLEQEINKAPFPFPLHRVTKGSLYKGSTTVRVSKKSGNTYVKHLPPAFMFREGHKPGILGRACTMDFKITPIQQAMRKIAHIKRGQKHTSITCWIGISKDEVIRMKESRLPWVKHTWPLVDLRMTREDCIAWMESRGFAKPPRSACYFCPYHSNHEWQRLKTEDPASFVKAQEYERALQGAVAQVDRLDGVPFLHPSGKPLATVDFTANEKNVWNTMQNECEGICGV